MPMKQVLLNHQAFCLQNHIFYQKGFTHPCAFENLYMELRRKENRLYGDEIVANLPEISRDHSQYFEWAVRKKSLHQLVNYLQKKKPNSILEIGCGNGWLSHQLAKLLPAEICAVDVNETELRQAAYLFKTYENLSRRRP